MHATAWLATDPGGGRWSDQLLSSQSASIGGGTNEIVRNVIAERLLGTPSRRGGRPHAGRSRPRPVETGGHRCPLNRRSSACCRACAWSRWAGIRGRTPGGDHPRRPGCRSGQGGAARGRPDAGRPARLRRLEPGQAHARARPHDGKWSPRAGCVAGSGGSAHGEPPARLPRASPFRRRRRGPGEGSGNDGLRRGRPRLVTCSISGWGSSGPSHDEPGWEPLVQARAGIQQGLFTGDDAIWQPFPVGSVAAALLAVLGAGAALVKRESTGYGQHVETSLLDGLLPLNAAPIFHRPGHRPHVHESEELGHPASLRDGRRPLRHGEPERHRALARAVPPARDRRRRPRLRHARGTVEALGQGVEPGQAGRGHRCFASKTADEWEAALLERPAAVAKCNTLAEWLDSEQARASDLVVETDDPVLGRVPLLGPSVRIGAEPGERRPGRRHGGEQGALGGHRIVDLSSFWAGPLASRLLAELGADVVKVEPPGGEGGFQMMPVLPNIYVDGNRSKRGLVLDLKAPSDRAPRPRGRVRRRGRERRGRRVGAARARRGGAAPRSTRRWSTPGPRASARSGPWPPGPRSTTWCRRRRGWR